MNGRCLPPSPSFSLSGNHANQVRRRLAGDEQHEWNNSQMSLLREGFADGLREQCSVLDFREHQMLKMWQQKALERWNKRSSEWATATVLMQGLLLPIFRLLADTEPIFVASFPFFLSRNGFSEFSVWGLLVES